MKKATITRIWIAGLVVLVIGLVIGGISLGMMLTNGGHWEPAATGNGSDFIPTMNGYFWTTLGFVITGFTVALAGFVVQVVAWIGALLNTNRLADKTWFWIMLGSGLLAFVTGPVGLAGMIAYIIVGPDGMALPQYEAPRHEQPQYQQPWYEQPMPAQPPQTPVLKR
ncbi:MAG TPA: hypothetical protein VF792_11800 [Ktedonobacterales bacterium]